MSLFVLPIIIWWIYYLRRLFNHAHDEQFLKMPWLYLWAAAYNTGWCYTLTHFFVLHRLETSIFRFTHVPLASLLCVSLYFLQVTSFLWIIKQQFTKQLILTFSMLGILYGIVLILHIHQIDYVTLYRYDMILIFISSSIAGTTLFFILRKEIQSPISHIEFAHLFWLTIFWLLYAIGLIVIALNAIWGLMFNETIIETATQAVGYLINMLAMFCMMIVTGRDTVLYRSIYPYRLWQYRKLLKLKDFILSHIEIDPIAVTVGNIHTKNIEIAIHETLVTTLDYYPYLLRNETLRLSLEEIEANTQDLETLLFKMTRLKIPTQK